MYRERLPVIAIFGVHSSPDTDTVIIVGSYLDTLISKLIQDEDGFFKTDFMIIIYISSGIERDRF